MFYSKSLQNLGEESISELLTGNPQPHYIYSFIHSFIHSFREKLRFPLHTFSLKNEDRKKSM